MQSIWDIINSAAGSIDGVTDWEQDRSDPTITQVRVDLADGTVIIAADEFDPETGEVDGWTASVYANEEELAMSGPGSQDGSDNTADFLDMVRSHAKGAARVSTRVSGVERRARAVARRRQARGRARQASPKDHIEYVEGVESRFRALADRYQYEDPDLSKRFTDARYEIGRLVDYLMYEA